MDENKKPVIVIALITGACVLGNEMLFIVMPIYWEFFGLTSLWQVGVLLSINRFIRLPMNPVVGWCYHKIDKRTGILIAVTLSIISTFSYGSLKGFWILLAMRILWGISWSFLRLGGYLTVISSSGNKTRGQFIGLYNGLWGLGTLFGMLIGGVFTELVGIRMITTVFAIIGILTIPLVIRFVPNTVSVPNVEKERKANSIFTDKKQLMILVNGLIVAFVIYGIFSSTISKVIEYQMDDKFIVLSFTVGAVAVAGLIQAFRMGLDPFIAPLIGKWSDQKCGRIPMLMIALLFGSISLFIIPLKIPFYLFLCLLLVFQLTSTLLITTSDSLAADLSTGPTGIKTMTYYTLSADLGSALGSLISFIVIDFIGLHWLYWITSSLLCMLLIFWCKESLVNNNKILNILLGRG